MPKKSRILSAAARGWLVAAALVLVAQAAILHQLSVREVNVPVPDLRHFPREFGSWRLANEDSLDPGVVDYLKPDSYILRDYNNPARATTTNLFVAFFKSLQNTYGPHSPHECLPGSGWLITSSSVPTFSVPGSNDGIAVNQYTMEKGTERILVVYWYQNDRRTWAEEFHAKLTLLPDLIRYRRSDVSLVRLITPVREGGLDQALSSTREFTSATYPLLVRSFQQTD